MESKTKSIKKVYSSIDRGCNAAFLGGVWMGIIPACLLMGYNNIVSFLLFGSFVFFFGGKYISLEPLFGNE